MRIWAMVAWAFLVFASAAPAHAESGSGKPEAGLECLVVAKDERGRDQVACGRVEIVTETEPVAGATDVGVTYRPRTAVGCQTTEAWLKNTRGTRIAMLWRVRTCERWTYDGIDVLDFQNPPTVTVEVPAPACIEDIPRTSGAHYTNDEDDPILAWGQARMACLNEMWWMLPVPGMVVDVRHEIYPAADGTYHH